MKNEVQKLFMKNNSAGLIAGIWGFLLTFAFIVPSITGVAFLLDAPAWVVCTLGIVVTISMIIGCVFLLFLEYLNPSVTSIRDFFRIILIAARYAIITPLVVPALMVLCLIWKWLAWTFIKLYLLPKLQREFSVANSPYTIVRPA